MCMTRKTLCLLIAIFVCLDGWENQFFENGVPGYCMNKIAGEIMFSGQQIEIDKFVAAVVYGRN